jgi:hypothetical protein
MRDKPTRTLFFLGILALGACAQDSPEQRLRDTIAAMEAAVEAKQPGEFVEHVSEDFTGEKGHFDRRSLRAFLAGQMLGAEKIEVVMSNPKVTMTGESRAKVEVDALVMGGRYLPERGERLKIVSGWRLEDGEWRCYTADRE